MKIDLGFSARPFGLRLDCGRFDTPEFKSWFKNSKCVDKEGKPAVLYHGTNRDIEAFNIDGGSGKTHGTGAFFSSSPATASTYATPAISGVVLPVFLSLQSPVIVQAAGANWNRLGARVSIELPEAIVSDLEAENLFAALTDQEPNLLAKKKLKARTTTLNKLFPGEFEYDDDFASTDDLARWARKQGYEGVIFRSIRDQGPSGSFATETSKAPSDLFVAFRAQQIKSALGNTGRFNPNSANICD